MSSTIAEHVMNLRYGAVDHVQYLSGQVGEVLQSALGSLRSAVTNLLQQIEPRLRVQVMSIALERFLQGPSRRPGTFQVAHHRSEVLPVVSDRVVLIGEGFEP